MQFLVMVSQLLAVINNILFMKIEKLLQVGLVSAFSISSLCLTSCDGGSGGQENLLPASLRAGEVIIINGNGGPTLTIEADNALSYDNGFDAVPAKYRFYTIGDRNVIDLRFDGLLVSGYRSLPLRLGVRCWWGSVAPSGVHPPILTILTG